MLTNTIGNGFKSLKLLAVNNLQAMLAYCDDRELCVSANDQLLHWFGKTRNDIAEGLTFQQLFGPMYEVARQHIADALSGRVVHFIWTFPLPFKREEYSALVSLFPDVEGGHTKGFVMHCADVSPLSPLKEYPAELERNISAQNKTLLNFANMVSHNLRSYANNMELMLSMYEAEQDEEEKKKIFDFIKEISSGLKSSVEDLTNVVKVQNLGNVPVEPVNLYNYTRRVTDILSVQLRDTRATIHNNIRPDHNVAANPAYIESIVLNFIDNAIKYRHPSRDPVIELSTMEVGNETVLNIRDNGLGMDLERNRQKLFGMYSTFHGNEDATGIGLFITKYQIDTMGGYVGVESVVGGGTWFRVYFRNYAVAG